MPCSQTTVQVISFLTVLSGQPFGFAFHLAFTVCDEFEYLSVALPG